MRARSTGLMARQASSAYRFLSSNVEPKWDKKNFFSPVHQPLPGFVSMGRMQVPIYRAPGRSPPGKNGAVQGAGQHYEGDEAEEFAPPQILRAHSIPECTAVR